MTEGVTSAIRLLAGRYQVGERIGRGGMADVHVGTDARLGRRVAIKLLKPSLANDPAFRTRFRREAQDAAKMAHPTIVRIFDAGEETVTDDEGAERQIPFIIMEFVDGRLLKDIIADGPMSSDEAVRITAQVLTALEYSHRAGVVHRDIKPGNIMVATTGQVKVMDFGIARAISESSATIAETSAIVGTAQYFSPEQARGESVDARTDLYSAGVVLFELLTGMAPFRGTNPVAVAYQHVNQNPAPPSTLNPRVSPALDVVVLRSLAKDRFSRFQSATDFRDELEAAANGTVVPKRATAEKDASLGLFGENPNDSSGTEATLRELNLADDDEQVTRTQSRPPAAWIWAGIMVMVVVIVSVLFWTVNLPSNQIVSSLSVAVPDVSGQTYDQAAAVLEAKNLVPQQLSDNSDTVPAGEVIRSEPDSGSDVSRQQIVKVYVSLGRASVTIPATAGLTLEAAQTALTSRGLQVGSVTQTDSPDAAANVVINTDPANDVTVAMGDVVNIVVSSGAVGIPNVVGMSASEAGTVLNTLQLDVTVTTTRGCSGRVVNSQSLPAGSHPQRSAISIQVCTG
ncbi:serine/threonine-protein kinase [Glaciihabitans tibetensis]|uniref:non-specific serine/threonine protein kinase n=1 Tax=Glaciihabitans tibetensis TaxID=1266600 RepID=A0A2T0VCP7_9MICO|nr:Stk1 family PASTA domain-containing Ser/Thr kinase [Glaciihabitans tibetensis]PRY67951.1 serine/threonine-protein kinase [Glaciihabitans tibetensis]